MSNPVFAAVRTVLAVRECEVKPIPNDVLERIVEAGHPSASSVNLQHWHFVVGRDYQALHE
ncbi:MAG: nitroreductase family protein [Candidatus Dormibacteraeota bacterium]|nr:nitroreductase family protein [Candidatus Dormibacteraeota bacterium]